MFWKVVLKLLYILKTNTFPMHNSVLGDIFRYFIISVLKTDPFSNLKLYLLDAKKPPKNENLFKAFLIKH